MIQDNVTIVLEGMDNAGKTTLGILLKETYGIPVIMGMGKPRSLEQALTWVHSALQYPRAIYDRFPLISDHIYGNALRGGSELTSSALSKHLWMAFLARRPLVIYCRPSDEAILNFGDRPQMEGVIDNAKRLLEAYDYWMMEAPIKYGVNVCLYNWQDPSALPNVHREIAAAFSKGEMV